MSKRSIIIICVIAVLFLLSFWAYHISASITQDIAVETESNKTDDGRAKVEEVVITETRDGQKFWEVYADSGQYNNNQDSARLTGVKGNFYRDKKVVLSFDAPVANYIAKNKGIKLSGGTRAATDNDILITSNELSWAGNEDKINAAGDVKIKKSKDFFVTSDRAIFSTDFKKIKVTGKSQTSVYKKN